MHDVSNNAETRPLLRSWLTFSPLYVNMISATSVSGSQGGSKIMVFFLINKMPATLALRVMLGLIHLFQLYALPIDKTILASGIV